MGWSSQALEDNEIGDDDGSDNSGQQLSETSGPPIHKYSPGPQLRFDGERKHRVGIVFGTSSSVDIVMPKRHSPGACPVSLLTSAPSVLIIRAGLPCETLLKWRRVRRSGSQTTLRNGSLNNTRFDTIVSVSLKIRSSSKLHLLGYPL